MGTRFIQFSWTHPIHTGGADAGRSNWNLLLSMEASNIKWFGRNLGAPVQCGLGLSKRTFDRRWPAIGAPTKALVCQNVGWRCFMRVCCEAYVSTRVLPPNKRKHGTLATHKACLKTPVGTEYASGHEFNLILTCNRCTNTDLRLVRPRMTSSPGTARWFQRRLSVCWVRSDPREWWTSATRNTLRKTTKLWN